MGKHRSFVFDTKWIVSRIYTHTLRWRKIFFQLLRDTTVAQGDMELIPNGNIFKIDTRCAPLSSSQLRVLLRQPSKTSWNEYTNGIHPRPGNRHYQNLCLWARLWFRKQLTFWNIDRRRIKFSTRDFSQPWKFTSSLILASKLGNIRGSRIATNRHAIGGFKNLCHCSYS